MPTRRQQRINEMLFEELSLLVPGQLDDPRLTGVRVTRVETTQDLSTAKVYVTAPVTEEPFANVVHALDHAQGVMRAELAALGLRRLPKLVFAQDKLFESGERVLQIIDHLRDLDHADSAAVAAGDFPDVARGPDASTP
jgi:ribosome-binding factor A